MSEQVNPERQAWDWCLQFFPMVLALDGDTQILKASDAIQLKVEDDLEGRRLQEVFDVIRPRFTKQALDLASLGGGLFLMHSKDRRIAIRGQLVEGDLDGQKCFFLVGSPWMGWLKQHSPNTILNGEDFPIHDAQLEQEFFLSSQQSMLNDLQALTVSLKEARDLAQQADKAKSKFVSHISHEMRTPLNGVISAINLLAKESLPAESSDLVSIAKTSSDVLLGIINEVLDFSRIGAGAATLEYSNFCPYMLVEEVARMLGPGANDKGLALRIESSIEGRKPCLGDEEKIRQVLVNLVGNAVKFSDSGAIEIGVECADLGQDRVSLRFAVQDQGRGIADSDQEHVFEPFWCKSAGLSSRESSTGLGLSICTQLIDSMGGKIGCDSELGKGSTFWFELELDVGNESALVVSNTTNNTSHFEGSILLVDDNSVNLTLGKLLLERFGLEVDCAADGQEAVEKIAVNRFDLVFMDITMPVMDGIEATKILRQQYTEDDLPIIALTANISATDKGRYEAAGMNGTLLKPIVEDELVAILARWLPQPTTQMGSDAAELIAEKGNADSEVAEPVLNTPVLEKLLSDVGRANIGLVVDQFIVETNALTESLVFAVEKRDYEDIQKLSHTLGSSVLAFGAQRFGTTLRQAEQAIKDKDFELAIELLSDVHSVSTQALSSIDVHINNMA